MVEEIKYVESKNSCNCGALKTYLIVQGGLILLNFFRPTLSWWIIFIPSIILIIMSIVTLITIGFLLRKMFENEKK